MELDVRDVLKEKGNSKRFSLRERIGSLFANGREVQLDEPVEIDVTATNTGKLVVLHGRLNAIVPMICDRCLKEVALSIEAEFEEEYRHIHKPPSRGADKGHEDEGQEYGDGAPEDVWSDDPEIRTFYDEVIEIEPAVKETLSIAIPMKVICKEDCKGLCPTCGKDLNEGPCNCEPVTQDLRMAPLAEALKKLRSPEQKG
ncbi:MAG TPA: DUF177 domain-containing protein [Firmicutes bacterium]|nr:DUF177 domain-containing protein [Bacillota bacterium]HHY98876.1 DUF177 domain-containing protein [Bacillota bacterium]